MTGEEAREETMRSDVWWIIAFVSAAIATASTAYLIINAGPPTPVQIVVAVFAGLVVSAALIAAYLGPFNEWMTLRRERTAEAVRGVGEKSARASAGLSNSLNQLSGFRDGGWLPPGSIGTYGTHAMLGASGGYIVPIKSKPQEPPARKEHGAVRMFRVWEITGVVAEGSDTPVIYFVDPRAAVKPEDLRLKALVSSHTWKPGENIAIDDPEVSRRIWGLGRGQGFYGFKSYDAMMKQEPTCRTVSKLRVAGTVLTYGRVHIAEHGARASHAIIESLIEPEGLDEAMRVVHLANHYGARIISEDTARNLKGGLVPYRKGQEL